MSEPAFDALAESLLENLLESLLEGVGRAAGTVTGTRKGADAEWDADLEGGVLTLEGNGGTWVLHKHAPTRQMWLSSPQSGAHHYAFDPALSQWRDTRGGADLVSTLIGEWGIPLEWRPE
jgi:frataxin